MNIIMKKKLIVIFLLVVLVFVFVVNVVNGIINVIGKIIVSLCFIDIVKLIVILDFGSINLNSKDIIFVEKEIIISFKDCLFIV